MQLILIVSVIIIILILVSAEHRIEALKKEITKDIKIERARAIQQSKSVTRGQVTEQMIPMFPDFPYSMSDCKFSGAPIDYIIFKGMSEFRDTSDGEISIIFADVKVGSAQRTKVQNRIKKAIEEGKVSFETWTIDKDNKIKIQ